MRITLTQQRGGLAIGATATLRLLLGPGGAPVAAADLVGVVDGAWSPVALGAGLVLSGGTLDATGGGGGGGMSGAYSLPQATTKVLGGVTVGSGIAVAGGVISVGSAEVIGALGLTPVDAAGAAAVAPVQSVAGRSGAVVLAAADVAGLAAVATSGAYADLTGAPASYTLSAATTKALGGVIAGANLSVAGDGTLSLSGANVIAALGLTPVSAAGAAAAAPVQSVAGRSGAVVLAAADVSGLAASATTDATNANNIGSGTLAAARLPLATTKAVGGVSVGSGLAIDGAGVLATIANGTVTSIVAGGMLSGGTVTTAGTISLAAPSAGITRSDGTALGVVTVGAGLTYSVSTLSANVTTVAGRTGAVVLAAADIASGTLAAARLPLATTSAVGGVKVGSNIAVASGVISVGSAEVVAALGFTPIAAAGAPVQTVAGRTGTVVLAAGDIASGTLAAARLPLATGAAVGGVQVGSGIAVAAGVISVGSAEVVGALGFTPIAAAGAPVQSVGGATGAVALTYGMTVDFSQGAVPAPGTITLDGGIAAGTTITQVLHKVGSAGGTIDFGVQIVAGGVPTSITGLAAVSSTGSSMTTTKATAANKAAIGDMLQLVITKVTGTPAGAALRIQGTQP